MKKYLPKFQNSGRFPKNNRNEKKTKQTTQDQVNNTNASVNQTSGSNAGGSPDGSQGNSVGNNTSKGGVGKTIVNGAMQLGGTATDFITNNLVEPSGNTAFNIQQKTGDMLIASGNPYAAAAGVIVKVASAAGEATGTNANLISKSEGNELGLKPWQRFLNNAGALVPGLGAIADKVGTVKMSEQTKSMSNAYAGTVDNIGMMEGMSGGRYFYGGGEINAKINEADRQNRLITDISLTNTQRKSSDYGLDLAQQNLYRYAGNNYSNLRAAKNGMKLASVEEIRKILDSKNTIPVFQNGGVISGNVLPTGKLHKELHHIEESNPELAEELTRKGIPVVAISDGAFEQVAEIEHSEWIATKEITDRIEELWKDGSEEAMIECGKLVCEQLLLETRDDNNILDGNNTDKDKQ